MTTVTLDSISRIEGHAKILIRYDKGRIEDVELKVLEDSRFFESILKGHKYDELPLVASRICGACSSAHALAAIKAIEDAFGIEPSDETRMLRELLAIGGLIQSHVLHLYFFVLPDYTGYRSVMEMAREKREDIETALRLKRLGHKVVSTIGGRDVHPVTTVVGGFSKVPTPEQLETLLDDFKACEKDSLYSFELFSSLSYPHFEHQTSYYALHDENLLGDSIFSLTDGTLTSFPHDFETYLQKHFQADSTADFVVSKGKSYSVGPQARLNVCWDLLDEKSKKTLDLQFPMKSPFENLIGQAFELASQAKRAQSLLEKLLQKPLSAQPQEEIKPKESTGIGVLEAPRGLLFHKFAFDRNGHCTYVDIVGPTSQNLQTMEECLREYLTQNRNLPNDEVISGIEKLIRAFDPCISCAVVS